MSQTSATILRETYHFVVVGGGIVGLSTAMHLLQEMPWARVVVLDKESKLAAHQTGNNSGVIHAGIYYKPGSLKAKFAAEGSRTMVEFCRKYGLPMKAVREGDRRHRSGRNPTAGKTVRTRHRQWFENGPA